MEANNERIDSLKKLPLISRDYVKLIDRYLIPYQLNSSLYYYIVKLYEFGDLPQDRLVQLTGINASNVTRAIQKLSDLNYLTKKENPEDRRGFLLSLTDEGKKMYPIIKECLKKVHNEFLAPLSKEEQQLFIEFIDRLAK
ncbi:MarR family transcriptional regulator [Enterococcus sp. 669A]|uniref:MarR family transcriptional regulator n=1 Tax=Candidatus Enterococcus moelleringii TaxID=2815325 RepID=A0ABS3LE47_9ENTE|nr:MarR family transcriptional regulator [Enterococcus sp. 669A]MBO1307914.1 MarR family transcriptional regulator [Enterococcus sp. 669A]